MAINPFRAFSTGFRLIDGTKLNKLFQGNEGMTPAIQGGTIDAATIGATTPASGTFLVNKGVPQIVTAIGATQGAAVAVTGSLAIITVCTASARGVKLPTAATGLMVRIVSLCTQGTKIYPFSNDRITSSATNAAVVLAGFKANLYIAKDTGTWGVLQGA